MYVSMDDRTPTTEVLANNLRYMMKDRGWNQKELARASGVSQRTVSNILSEVKTPTLDTVELLAKAFGLTMWHLIMPTLIDDLQSPTSIKDVYDKYFAASLEGRAHILSVSDREARYNKAS